MLGPCWGHVFSSSSTRLARALKFLRLSQHGLSPMSMVCQLFGTQSCPCVDYVWFKSIYRPTRVLLFQRQIGYGLKPIFIVSTSWVQVKALFGLCLDHVWPSFTPRPARALEFLRLSQLGLNLIFIVYLLFWTMSGPCLHHIGTIFGPSLCSDPLELWNFQDWVNIV